MYTATSIRKTFVQFVQKKAQSFAFVALHFCAKNIIRKLLFVQNCVIPLLCNSVLCNFAEQILSKRFNKGLNCINYLFMRFHFFVYKCNDWKEEDDLPKTIYQPDSWWHTATQDVHDLTQRPSTTQDVHDLTQRSSSILPITHFKLKIETDA